MKQAKERLIWKYVGIYMTKEHLQTYKTASLTTVLDIIVALLDGYDAS